MTRRLLPILLFSFAACFGQSITYVTDVSAMVDDSYDRIYVENDPALQTISISGLTGNAMAQGRIAPGITSTFGHWDSLDEDTPAGSLMADALTHWTDEVTISDPNLDGTLGHFTASLRVFGSASFNLTGGYASGDLMSDTQVYGFWDSWIGTSTDGGGSFLVGGWFGDWRSDIDGTVWYEGDELNQPETEVTLDFIYGQPFLLRMNLESYIDASNPNLLAGTVEGTVDFSHTAYWNGISGFFDANGNAVNPSLSSQSGVDWRAAVVPEPASISILSLGFLALLRRKQRG